MKRSAVLGVLCVVSLIAILTPLNLASAQVLQSVQECTIGKRVQTGDSHTGTITRIDRAWSYCYVRQDDTGKEVEYLYSLLSPAGKAGQTGQGAPSGVAAAGLTLTPGAYECWNDNVPANINFRFTGPSSYATAGKSGKYRIEPSGKIVFETGPFTDVFAKLLANNRVGLNMNGDSFYQTSCDLNSHGH